MNDNDILIYKKYKFEEIKDVIETLSHPEKITRSLLASLFSNRGTKQDPVTKEIIVSPPKYRLTDYFDLPAKTLPNQLTEIKDTTIGIFLFNSFVIYQAFGTKIAYVNKTMNEKVIGNLVKGLSKMIMEKQLEVKEYAKFADYAVWLGYMSELCMPGMSIELIVPPKELTKYKNELLKAKPELAEKKVVDLTSVAAYHDEIEIPLLDKAKEIRDSNYAGRVYEMKKPSFDNNYKNKNITNGAMFDPVTGKYKINTNSFNDGIDEWNFDVLANKCMVASYNRGVNTQIGGTYAKYVGIMMQTVKAGPKGSDCGSKGYVKFAVTKDNKDTIVSSYGLINGKEVEITEEIANSLVGKVVQLRSPLFCKSPKFMCNKCVGNRYYQLGITNIGLTTNVPLDKQKNKSMKSMHDVSVHTIPIEPSEYVEFVS
jgi:hypothetical protein